MLFQFVMRNAFNECHREKFSHDYVKNFQSYLHGCSGAIVHQENFGSANIASYQLLVLNKETH